MKRLEFWLSFACSMAALVASAATATTPEFRLSPAKSVTPEVLAKANCVTNYDGDGHSIQVVTLLNPLIAANNPQVAYSLLQDGTFEAQNPVFTNVVATSVWYRIAEDNFKPFTTNALLKITPRPVTITSGTKTDFVYDGQPHQFSVLVKSENGFIAGYDIVSISDPLYKATDFKFTGVASTDERGGFPFAAGFDILFKKWEE